MMINLHTNDVRNQIRWCVYFDDVMVEVDLVLRVLLSSPPIAISILQLITLRVHYLCGSDFLIKFCGVFMN